MKETALNPHLTWLEPASMSNFSGCNGLLIEGRLKIGIDTNFGEETAAWLAAAQPDVVIASHYHIDHVASLKHAEKAGIPQLLIPAGEVHMVNEPRNYQHLVDEQGPLLELWKSLLTRYSFWPSGPVQALHSIDLADLGVGLVTIPTPGHSPDHTSFYFADDAILFTGDMGIDAFGPWYCWPDCDLRTLVDSLIRLREMNAKTLVTSHGGMIQGASACRTAFDKAIEVVRQREIHIEKLMAQGVSSREIVEEGLLYPGHRNYKTEFRHIMGYWEEKTLLQHQTALQAGGIFSDSDLH